MTANIVRDLTTENDQFICDCEVEPEPKPLRKFELYMQGAHVPLPFYSAKRWPVVGDALRSIVSAGPELTFFDFMAYYKSYHSGELDFSALEALINSGWRGGTVLSELLPAIAELALEARHQFRQPIRLLKRGQNGSLTLSQRQAAVLLANAFYSTFPARDLTRYNRINFIKLFKGKTPRAVEKLKCVLHYFSEFNRSKPAGAISIIRQKLANPELINWAEMEGPLTSLVVMPTGKIENEGRQMTQLDFANEYIGGGVLGYGCVQEEIRFLICPELIVSCLVCERMDDDEAILLMGAERYSNYDGYDGHFQWLHRGRHNSPERDAQKRAKNELLAIDALNYAGLKVQFKEKYIRRELLKAYAGFSFGHTTSPPEIATGNWGCGAFRGDLHLKSMIQLMAASAARRPLYYFTFGGEVFAQELDETVKLMERRGVTIAQLYRIIIEYGGAETIRPCGLFQWIKRQIDGGVSAAADGSM